MRSRLMPDSRSRSFREIGRGIVALLSVGAVVLGLAACGSSSSSSSSSTSSSTASTASGGPGAGKPAVTIGDKNFPEENILGELYAQALKAKGYKVNLKPNVGSSEIIYKAFTSGQIQMYPEYTGVFLSAVAEQTKLPKSAIEAYTQAKAFAETKGATMLEYTPFYDSDALATLPAYASEHNLKSVADLKPLGSKVTLGGAPEFATRFQGVKGLEQEYGLKMTFKPIAIELSYKALESKQVDVQDVFTTDGQLLGGKFKVLEDPKKVFGFQNVAPIVKQSVLSEEGPEFEATINKVSALLTIPAIQQMNKAVTIEKQSATSVAAQFLKANGIV
jgi:osmoprotectant transport system substrate-binding protein